MSDITFFAQTTFRNQMRKFGIKTDDRRRHMYLIGKTGMGKSTVLENMIIDDIRAGHGVAVIDPHGDLAEKVIEFIPDNRIKDVIYFNPADIDYPIAFNVVEQVEPHLRHLVASGLIGVFQKLWADSWGPRLEYILRNAILAILDYPGSTLLGVVRILSDKNFRKKVVSNIKDPVVKAFWEKEFASYADKFASEAVSPIQNKVGQFLSTAFMRNIVGQISSSLDMRKIMDEGKILIMNLSKGRIGEDNSALLGAMMITKIQLAAMSRVEIPENERRDFYLYIDEFQNFSTDSFANILSEARKYRLCLVMAHQYIEQLEDKNSKVKAAVFGNVGTMIVFRVGAADAEELVKEFTPVFEEEDIVNLPKYEMYLKLMIDGVSSDPFSARGLPPLNSLEKTNNVQKVIDYSREKYASRKDDVEERIIRWHENFDDPGDSTTIVVPSVSSSETAVQAPWLPKSVPASAPANVLNQGYTQSQANIKSPAQPEDSSQRPASVPRPQTPVQVNRPRFVGASVPTSAPARSPQFTPQVPRRSESAERLGFDATCSMCKKNIKTPFKPDGVRPVFCPDCLKKSRDNKKNEVEARKLAKVEELKNLKMPLYPTVSTPSDISSSAFETKADVSPLTLASIGKAAPVDFHGREIKNQINPAPLDLSDEDSLLSDPASDSSGLSSSGKLEEGHGVKISQE